MLLCFYRFEVVGLVLHPNAVPQIHAGGPDIQQLIP